MLTNVKKIYISKKKKKKKTYCYTQCHSPHATTGSAFFRFSQLATYTIESIAVITYAYSYMGLSLDF